MTNDENGLYELSRDLNLSLLSLNNFYESMDKNKNTTISWRCKRL